MAGFRLDWRGPELLAAVEQAARQGIDETMAECVLAAQVRAPRLTGAMANNIKIISRAKASRGGASGTWGNDTQEYTLGQEIGQGGRPGRYFLRSAADREYPRLAARIRAWAKLGR